MTSISNAVAETADVRDIMALEPSSRENAATPTALDFASPVSEGKDPSPRELLAPEASPPADDASDGGATPPEADSPDGSAAAAAAGDGMSEEERQSIELAMRLQAEEEARMEEEADALERMQGMPASTEDEESLRLAIQLQQEEDDATLRRFLGEQAGVADGGADGDGRGGGAISPSQYSYEQLLRLGDSVGTVSRGASEEAIQALGGVVELTAAVRAQCAHGAIVLGEQCSICRMEFEDGEELRVLPCKHAEHAACLDQWLAVNRTCPICAHEVPSGK